MTGYVIRRSDGAFVAKPGSKGSYTVSITAARIYPTIEAAQVDLCKGNERVAPLVANFFEQ